MALEKYFNKIICLYKIIYDGDLTS